MKNLAFILILCLVGLGSCKKNDEAGKTNPVPENLRNNIQGIAMKGFSDNNWSGLNESWGLWIKENGIDYSAYGQFGSRSGKLRWEPGNPAKIVLMNDDGTIAELTDVTYDDDFVFLKYATCPACQSNDYILATGSYKIAGMIQTQINSSTTLPLQGVTVDLMSGTTILDTATTNNNGLYSFTASIGGSFEIRARKSGYTDKKYTANAVPIGSSSASMLLTAGSSSLNTMSGHFIRTQSGYDYEYIDFEANNKFTWKTKITGESESVITGTYLITQYPAYTGDVVEFIIETGGTPGNKMILKKISDTTLQSIDGSSSFTKQ